MLKVISKCALSILSRKYLVCARTFVKLAQFQPIYTSRFFAKKAKKQLDKKKERAAKLKEETAKEFEGIDDEDFLKELRDKLDAVFNGFKTQLRAMKVTKASPKTIEKVPIYVQGIQRSIQDVADITIKSADTICIIPRDYMYIDPILKGLMAARIDMQFTVEEKMIVGRIEKSATELREDIVKEIQRLEEQTKNTIRGIRSTYAMKVRRIKMIASIDDVRKLAASVDMYQTKYIELVKRYASDKAQAIKGPE